MGKRVFLDVQWKMHSLYNELVLSPPEGYQFVTAPTSIDHMSRLASKMRLAYVLQQRILAPLLPLVLLKSYMEKYLKTPPDRPDLTYACEHLVFREEDWVVSMGGVTELVGGEGRHVRQFRKLIEAKLGSIRCKGVICYYEAARKSLETGLDCRGFEDKIFVVHLAVRKKSLDKNHNRERVRLLFVGSVNIPGQFEIKGGREALEAFVNLQKKYDNLELVIRSDVPQDIRDRYRGLPNLRIIDQIIPWETLEQEFLAADIFVFPAHCTVGMAMLDAMSYEMPVVTTDVYANPELVQDGATGFVVRRSDNVPYSRSGLPVSMFSRSFAKAIKRTDRRLVEDIVRQTSILIENPDLRRRMGKAARQEIEEGKFSIERRNRKLKEILDRATAEGGSLRGRARGGSVGLVPRHDGKLRDE
jgi:glycosyltransferase involved in cell wall biosynthesis